MEDRTEALGYVPAELLGTDDKKFVLLALGGPQKGATFPLEEGRSTVGRSKKADVCLEGRGLSRIHASLQVGTNSVFLRDEGSTNGVFVNGAQVSEKELRPGDKVGFGPEVVMRLDLPDQEVLSLMNEMYEGATLDSLTGILNRKAFRQRLNDEFKVAQRHGQPSCVALMDVDKFKSVNDNYGHPAGDAVLVVLGQLLSDQVRTGDLVGRWGGEEFIYFIRQTDIQGAVIALNRMRERLQNTPIEVPTPEGIQTIHVTMSIGVSAFGAHQDLDQVVAAADEALYEAKQSGRNRVMVR